MNQLMNTESLTMSSREIAELTGKQLSHVHRDIKSMLASLYGDDDPILDDVIFVYDERRYVVEIKLDEDHTLNLVTGYDSRLRMKVIKRWRELEGKQLQPALPDFNNPVESARAWADAKESEQKALEVIKQQAPAVKFVENYTQANTGSKGFREVAKLLKVKENAFRKFLTDNKIMYRLAGSWTAYQNHIDADRFEVTTGENNGHVHNTTKFTGKGINWIAGLYAQSQIGE